MKKYTVQKTMTVSRMRCIASQVVACLSPNILLVDLGMAISFSTITVPVLLNAAEGLSINEVQASWFGSIAFLAQPFGAVLSGPLVDYFGRKRGNIISNLPHLIAWTLTYFAWDIPSLFLANALLGFGTGLMEAPICAYVSEVTEPSIRGPMCSLIQTWASTGVFLMYFLGLVVSWRVAAIISLSLPVLSMLAAVMAPDTPIWLLSRDREHDAMKSLCYLRGWTKPENVDTEFQMLSNYTKELKKCVICKSKDNDFKDSKCEHDEMNVFKRSILKFRYTMLCKDTMRPFLLTIMYFMFLTMSGLYPARPNMVNVCGAFGMADDGKRITLIVGVLLLVASIIVSAVIRYLGKRKVAITAMFGTFIFSAALSIYANKNLSENVFSYNTETFPKTTSVEPLIYFYFLALFTGFGVPWVLLGEVFPFKSRGAAQGCAAAWNYIIAFIASKTFIDLEISIHLWGTYAVYAGFALLGTIYLYLYLPETEGKTLQEIEKFYDGDRQRIFADDPFTRCFKKLKR